MPDLLAGTVVAALDTPPAAINTQTGAFTFNATSYGVDNDSGTYVDCGVAFTACTTGRMMIEWRAQIDNDTAGQFTACSFVVREGSTVGAGAVVLAASDDRAIIEAGTDVFQMSQFYPITGLTPGNVYNVRLEHKVGGNVGTLERRQVCVTPLS